jgi:hypothetical protein
MFDRLPDTLALINAIIQGAIVVFGVSVTLYNVRHIFHDRVTRAFNSLLFFVVITYFMELLVNLVTVPLSAETWVRLEWIGIAMVPAAQFHLADALLVTTGDVSKRRRMSVRIWYLIGVAFFTLAIVTDLVVVELIPLLHAPHLGANPIFAIFTIYYWLISATSVRYIWQARERCVTQTTRKRVTVILITFLAAPLAVFPYLSFSTDPASNISVPFWLIIIFGNVVVSLMFAFMTYYISYFGATSPDRVVRVRLFKFMARVPLAATIVLLVFVGVKRAGSVLGLPVETTLAIAVVGTIILVEWAIHAFKRPLELLFQLTDEPEVRRIQELSERVITTRDMRQFLESVLAATCEVLRSPRAFVASFTPSGPRLEAVVGPFDDSEGLWPDAQLQEWAASASDSNHDHDQLIIEGDFVLWREYWIRPLQRKDDGMLVGILGIKGRAAVPDLSDVERDAFEGLAEQTIRALSDRVLQREVFAAVEGLLPQVTALQRTRSQATFGGTPILTTPVHGEARITTDPEFNNMVRDALSHYWGGPKLTKSPLMRLRVVQEAINRHGGNPTKALRDILSVAVEQQRPDGERSMTTAEWILYNILELKFIQGQKVRDVARRLAMSESDLYRKQRIAVEVVARSISTMEEVSSTDTTEVDENQGAHTMHLTETPPQ